MARIIHPLELFDSAENGSMFYKNGVIIDEIKDVGPGIFESWKYSFDEGKQIFRATDTNKVYEKRLVKDSYGIARWTAWLNVTASEAYGVQGIAVNDGAVKLPNKDGVFKLELDATTLGTFTKDETYDLIESMINDRDESKYEFIEWPLNSAGQAILEDGGNYVDAEYVIRNYRKLPDGSYAPSDSQGTKGVLYIVNAAPGVDATDPRGASTQFIWDTVGGKADWVELNSATELGNLVSNTVFLAHANDTNIHVALTDKENWNAKVGREEYEQLIVDKLDTGLFNEHVDGMTVARDVDGKIEEVLIDLTKNPWHVSSFDRARWDSAISGTAFYSHVDDIDNPDSQNKIHVSTTDRVNWDNKVDSIPTDGKYYVGKDGKWAPSLVQATFEEDSNNTEIRESSTVYKQTTFPITASITKVNTNFTNIWTELKAQGKIVKEVRVSFANASTQGVDMYYKLTYPANEATGSYVELSSSRADVYNVDDYRIFSEGNKDSLYGTLSPVYALYDVKDDEEKRYSVKWFFRVTGDTLTNLGNAYLMPIEAIPEGTTLTYTMFSLRAYEADNYLKQKYNDIVAPSDQKAFVVNSVAGLPVKVYNVRSADKLFTSLEVVMSGAWAGSALVEGLSIEVTTVNQSYINVGDPDVKLNLITKAETNGTGIVYLNGQEFLTSAESSLAAKTAKWGGIYGLIQEQSDLVNYINEYTLKKLDAGPQSALRYDNINGNGWIPSLAQHITLDSAGVETAMTSTTTNIIDGYNLNNNKPSYDSSAVENGAILITDLQAKFEDLQNEGKIMSDITVEFSVLSASVATNGIYFTTDNADIPPSGIILPYGTVRANGTVVQPGDADLSQSWHIGPKTFNTIYVNAVAQLPLGTVIIEAAKALEINVQSYNYNTAKVGEIGKATYLRGSNINIGKYTEDGSITSKVTVDSQNGISVTNGTEENFASSAVSSRLVSDSISLTSQTLNLGEDITTSAIILKDALDNVKVLGTPIKELFFEEETTEIVRTFNIVLP